MTEDGTTGDSTTADGATDPVTPGSVAPVSVKVRAEVDGVDLPEVARTVADAGGDALHVDAMDSEPVIAEVAEVAAVADDADAADATDATDAADAGDLFVIANNEVRDEATVREYLAYGADAVSVGRPSDDPAVLRRVRAAVDDWFAERGRNDGSDREDASDRVDASDQEDAEVKP